MTRTAIQETIRQMMIDWNAATEEQRSAALARSARLAKAAEARARLVTYPVVRKNGRVVNVTIPED